MIAALLIVAAVVLMARSARKARTAANRAEAFAALAGLRRGPGESNGELIERAARRFGAGLGLTPGGRRG